jgi:hypothetical protein
MKKKTLIFLILLLFITFVYAQEFKKNKYSTEIDCEDPFPFINVSEYLKSAEREIDLEQYKTVIRNGDINAIEKPYLNDLQLGALTTVELKLFRNLFYAKKGFVFSDDELTKYFSQFEWYKPESKNVSFTQLEKSAIERIKIFESESSRTYEFENRTIVWEAFNGGADQRAQCLKLNQDKTFEYIPSETINRLQSIKGTWKIGKNRIVLSVESENVLLGGYVADHPNTPYIDKGTPVIITYKNAIKISLPLNESKLYKKYNFEWGEKWIMIGSSDYYISK